MKVTVNAKELTNALKIVKPAVRSKSSLPILGCVKLEAIGSTLSITTTCLDMYITATVPIEEPERDGGALISYTQLVNAAKTPTKYITIEEVGETGENVEVTGIMSLTVKNWDVSEFPTRDKDDESLYDTVSIAYADMLEAVTMTAVTTQSPNKYDSTLKLTCILLQPGENDTQAFYGGDGKQLTRIQVPKEGDLQNEVMIPAENLLPFIKALPKNTGKVYITHQPDKNYVVIWAEGVRAILQTVEGHYASVGDAFNPLSTYTTRATVNRKELLDAYEAVLPVAKESGYTSKMSINGSLKVEAEGETRDGQKLNFAMSVNAVKHGEDIELRMQAKQVRDILSVWKVDQVQLHLRGAYKPVRVEVSGTCRYTWIVMPMKY